MPFSLSQLSLSHSFSRSLSMSEQKACPKLVSIICGKDTQSGFSGNILNAFRTRGFDASIMVVDHQKELLINTIEESISIIPVFSKSFLPSEPPWDTLSAVINQGKNSQLLVSVYYKMSPAPTQVPDSVSFHFPGDGGMYEWQFIEDVRMKVSEHVASKIEQHDGISALQVLCLYAFGSMNMDFKDINIIHRAVILASGNPSALKAIGCSFRGKTTVDCESALELYEKMPNADLIPYLIGENNHIKLPDDTLDENMEYGMPDVQLPKMMEAECDVF